MIDVGKIPAAVANGIAFACEDAESYVEQTAKKMWADSQDIETAENYERFLNIANKAGTLSQRTQTILAYLNAKGSPGEEWFYELAEFLGYRRGIYEDGTMVDGVRRGGTWAFAHPYYGAAIYFTDGESLPFRAQISAAGDSVFDNIKFGATTCTVYYRKGNAKIDFSAALKDLIRAARNVGTVLVFVNTEE